MFRGPTSRGNIRYQVHQVEGETVVEAISQVVKEKLEQYPAPSKIVVYSGSVNQTIKVGEALGCPIYHRNVDSRAGKAQRMKELMEGKSRVISATNALGLGVDLPDIRVVIHAGPPAKLRDYAQESGRAGRDREKSEAIIVRQHMHAPQGQTPRSWTRSEGEDIDEFVAGYHCRRVIIDQVMDGRVDRVECEEGEEQCDVCQQDQEVDLAVMQLPRLGSVHASKGLSMLSRDGGLGSEGGFGDSGISNSMSS